MASADPPRVRPSDDDALIVMKSLRLEDFFPELSGEQCAKLFPRSGVGDYAAGDFLIEQDEAGRDLFVVVEGAFTITKSMGSAAAELATIGPGAVLGEIALIREGTRTASAIAAGPARAFRLAYADMDYILANNPKLAMHLQNLAREREA
ncbi:MAG: cyclic nucleotide-binding domain-containing protein [Elusimicrobia bacterium]|nr:cyclic nucleotide-binding domain-containing protein [Elusimicrobiota bacterium]